MIIQRNLFRVFQTTAGFLKRESLIQTPRQSFTRDPLEELFEEKRKEYNDKTSEGKMLEPTKEILAELEQELNRMAQKFGAKTRAELEVFPDLNFPEPVLDPLTGQFDAEEKVRKEEEKKREEARKVDEEKHKQEVEKLRLEAEQTKAEEEKLKQLAKQKKTEKEPKK